MTRYAIINVSFILSNDTIRVRRYIILNALFLLSNETITMVRFTNINSLINSLQNCVNWPVSWNRNILEKLGQYHSCWWPGPRFNIKMTSYQYRKSHCGDMTILRPSYLHNGISYTCKMTSLHCQDISNHGIDHARSMAIVFQEGGLQLPVLSKVLGNICFNLWYGS